MYKTIQRLVGHRIYRIGPDGPCGYNSTEDKVSVLMANGDWKTIPFGGFMEVGNVVVVGVCNASKDNGCICAML